MSVPECLRTKNGVAPLFNPVRDMYELGRPRDGKISPPPLSKPIAAE